MAGIEKKAFHFARLATSSTEDALDLVQEAMIKLVSHYADRDSEQWKALFYRILQNKITDYHRHQKVKNLLFFWKSDTDECDDDWHLDNHAVADGLQYDEGLIVQQQHSRVLRQLAKLSHQQQQCFLLRSWEGLSVAETAEIMQCSQGSIKTHYSRATEKLKTLLEADDDFQR